MKKYFLLAFLGLTVWPCIGQVPIYFSKHYDLSPSPNDYGARVITIPGGYAFTSVGNYAQGSAMGVADLNGDLLYKKQFMPPFNRIDALSYNKADSTFLILGDHSLGNNDWVIYLLKTTFWGDTIWVKEYNPLGGDLPKNMLELPDGSIMLVCKGVDPYDFVNVIKTDPDGNFLWIKSYDYDFQVFQDAWGIILANDSTVTISFEGGSIYRPYPDTINPTRLYWNGMGLIDIDFDGNVRRDSVYLFALGGSDRTGPCYVQSNGQGILFVAAGKEDQVAWAGADMLHAFDEKTWELLWSFRFDEIDPQDPKYHWVDPYLAHFTVNKKGNVVVCGKQYNFQYDVPGSNGDSFLPWFAEVSKDGELLWQRWVGWPTICGNVVCDALSSFENIQPTDDGGYILTGQYGLQNGVIEAWLLKVDSMGCLEPGCTDRNVLVPVNEPDKNDAPRLTVFPNPADAYLQISTEDMAQEATLQLMNAQGRIVATVQLPEGTHQENIQTEGLPAGLYFYRVMAKGKTNQTGKVVIKH